MKDVRSRLRPQHPGVIDEVLGYLSRCDWNWKPSAPCVDARGVKSGSSLSMAWVNHGLQVRVRGGEPTMA